MAVERVFRRAMAALQIHIKQVALPDHLRQDANAYKALREVSIDVDSIVNEADVSVAVDRASLDADHENVRALQRIPGLSADDFFSTPSTVDEFRTRNVGLIKTLSRDLLGDMKATLDSPEAQGLHVSDLTALLEERFGVFQSRARFWAVDQTLKLNADITQKRMASAGIRKYVWTTAGDERVRGKPGGKWEDSPGDHWHLEGQVFAFGDDPVTDPSTGERNAPGKDYRCRCVAYPLIGKDAEE